MWKSVLKNGDDFIFGLDKEVVIGVTRTHLKRIQDGTLQSHSRVVNSGVVGGKL